MFPALWALWPVPRNVCWSGGAGLHADLVSLAESTPDSHCPSSHPASSVPFCFLTNIRYFLYGWFCSCPDVNWSLTVALTSTPLMVFEFQCLSVCLLSTCIFALEKCHNLQSLVSFYVNYFYKSRNQSTLAFAVPGNEPDTSHVRSPVCHHCTSPSPLPIL